MRASSRRRSKPPDQVEPVHHLHGRNHGGSELLALQIANRLSHSARLRVKVCRFLAFRSRCPRRDSAKMSANGSPGRNGGQPVLGPVCFFLKAPFKTPRLQRGRVVNLKIRTLGDLMRTSGVTPKTQSSSPKRRVLTSLATILAASGVVVANPSAAFANSTFTAVGYCDTNYQCAGGSGSSSRWSVNFDDGPTVSTIDLHELYRDQSDTMSSFRILGSVMSRANHPNETVTIHQQFYRDNGGQVPLGEYETRFRASSSNNAQRFNFDQGIPNLPWNDQVSSVAIWITRK